MTMRTMMLPPAMPTMSAREFGELINRLHLSSRQAANALGVSQRQIFYYLSGEHPVPGTVALLLRTKMALLQALQALHALDPDWPNAPITFDPGSRPIAPA